MRQTTRRQLSLMPTLRDHRQLAELQQQSEILDSNPEILELVYADLVRGLRADKGYEGLSADQVLRAAILYRARRFTYEELSFELTYHAAYRSFCRLGMKDYPCKSTLNRDIGRLLPETWEAINRILIAYAVSIGVEDGSKVRTDCTVTETNIHEPSDSSLLWDCVRVLTRQLKEASALVNVFYRDHQTRAKRRAFGIRNAKIMKDRKPLYGDLLKVTRKTVGYSKRTVLALRQRKHILAPAQADSMQAIIDLTLRVIDQTERRVVRDESVPAGEKLLSIFEPHTDVIRKDRRDTLYGHKLSLSAGPSNLITDCVILAGNPADSTLAVDMMKRHVEIFGEPPKQVAFDGGFSSIKNLGDLKELGIEDVAFTKAKGFSISDMVKDSRVYQQLRDFRAGIEGIISFLKRGFGMGRCTWKGLRSFKSYAWSSVVSANLLTLARHALAK